MQEDCISIKKGFQYKDCIRKCFVCRVGASNSRSKPTIIYEDYKKNIPSSLLHNLDYTLNNSNNVRNRTSKKVKIGYSTSEDAVSWIFINYFIQNQKLEILKKLLNCKSNIIEVLMWGVPQIDREFENPLKDICRKLGEKENSFSEPDIIVICEGEIDFIEVKVKSNNEKKNPEKINFDKYLNNNFYLDKKLAKNSKYYELIRNWTIANSFSKIKMIRLLNLAPKKLFYKEKNADFLNFISSLVRKENFEQIAWEDIIKKMDSYSIDIEIVNELKKRIK